MAPPVDKAGLPKVGRYTNTAQLDWMLGAYTDAAQRSADPQVREAACLGWERAVFDLQSFQMYSVVLRLSAESTALQSAGADLPTVMQRHPLPAACGAVPEGPASAQAVEAAVAKAEEQRSDDVKGAPGEGTSQSGQPQAIAQPGPPQPQPAVPALTERQLLGELRQALGMHRSGVTAGSVDDARLLALAGSDIPTIQLRARFHLLGRCQSLVERYDAFPTEAGRCAGAAPGEDPRRGMIRLRDQLLRAWSRRYVEPMSDIVIALANSTSRDNPVVDGPRVSR